MTKYFSLALFLVFFTSFLQGALERRLFFLEKEYTFLCCEDVLYNEVAPFMPRLRGLAKECESVIEVGGDLGAGSISIVLGLSENLHQKKKFSVVSYRGITPQDMKKKIYKFKVPAIHFSFEQGEYLGKNIEYADMVYINSFHTYARLVSELEHFAPRTGKYLAVLHTGFPWGYEDEPDYYLKRYVPPAWIRKDLKGLVKAVEEFLLLHPEWEKFEEYTNSHGFTILKRVK
jgi:hypothetical protein